MAKHEYMVIRKITTRKTGNVAYEPYTVLANSPLEASEAVASELYPTQTVGNDYSFMAHTVKSFSTYSEEKTVIVKLNKLGPASGKSTPKLGGQE